MSPDSRDRQSSTSKSARFPGEPSLSQPGAVDASGSRNRDWLDRYPPDESVEQIKDQADEGAGYRGRVRAEKVPVDAEIDLHGLRLEEAMVTTSRFIDESRALGYRKIVVIHGKGENGEGILRREIRRLIEQHPGTGEMGYAKGNEGGRGALWVMLRENVTEHSPSSIAPDR